MSKVKYASVGLKVYLFDRSSDNMKPRNTYSKEIRTGTLDMKSHLFFTRFQQFCGIVEDQSFSNPAALNLNPDSAAHDYRAGHGSHGQMGLSFHLCKVGVKISVNQKWKPPSTLPGTESFWKGSWHFPILYQESHFSQVM